MFKPGEKLVLDTNLPKGNQQIVIHPAYHASFPQALPKGSLGEVVESKSDEVFVKFMIKAPGKWEQEYLAGNVVHFTVKRVGFWMLKRRA